MNVRMIILAAAALLFSTTAGAQGFDLSWNTIDGGGATFSVGGAFSLGGTIGQPDAGVMSGGQFTLIGGFWAGAASVPCDLPGDLEGDGDVDITDLATLLAHFGMQSGADPSDGDLDGDQDVDISDLSSLLSNFGLTCP